MKDNNILVVVLVTLVILLGGLSLILGVNNSISSQMAPLSRQLTELTSIVRDIQSKENARGNSDLETTQLMILNQRIASLEARAANNGNGGNFGQQPFGQQRPNAPSEDYNKVYPIDIGTSPILGNPNAPVTITEFSDFQCPFCARFHPILHDVLSAYPGKVKVVIKNYPLPFHPNARPAAKLAMAANLQGKYYEMVDQLMQNGGSVDEDKIKGYAKTLNINYNKLMDDYKNKDAQWEKIIADDQALAAQVGVQGTPTFLINGRKTMARDLNTYKTEIDKILKP